MSQHPTTQGLAPGDRIITPTVGPSGYVVITGSPAAVVMHSGTLTAAAAQSGNALGTITDSALLGTWSNSGPGSTSLVGFRLRITSGARAGTISFIAADNGGKVAGIGDPELISLAAPMGFSFTTQTLAAGDSYVIERLPLVGCLAIGGAVACDFTDGNGARLVIEGVATSNYSFASGVAPVLAFGWIPPQGEVQNAIRLIGCAAGSYTGSYFAHVCTWDDFGFTPNSGDMPQLFGCVIYGDMDVTPGTSTTLSQGTVIVGGGGSTVQGVLNAQNLGIVGAADDALEVLPSGTVNAQTALWGAGSTGYGIKVQSGGKVCWGTKPTVTGTTGDTIVGGTAKTYSALSTAGFVNMANLAEIVPVA